MNGYIALVGITTFGAVAYLLNVKKQKPEIFRSHNRYLLYNNLLFMGAIVFAVAGLETRNNWFVLVFSVLMALMNYYGPAWSKINQDIVCNKTTKTGRVIRPGLALLISLTMVYQFLAIVVLIGSGKFSTINLAAPQEAKTNFWAWNYIIAGAGLTTGCTILFLLECLKTAKSVTDTNTVNGLWHQYRSYGFAIIAFFDAIFFGLMLVGNLSYSFSPKGSFDQVCTMLRNQVLLLLCLAFLAQHFLDRRMFKWYIAWHRRRLIRLTKELEWLYYAACQLFDASYRLNPYKLNWSETQSVESSLIIVVNCLNETRKWLYREEDSPLTTAVGKERNKKALLPNANIKSEAKMWANHLSSSRQAEVFPSTSEGKVPPALRSIGVEGKAIYYVKLSRKIQKLMKCKEVGACNA